MSNKTLEKVKAPIGYNKKLKDNEFKCVVCGKEFRRGGNKKYTAKFCSVSCKAISQKGKKPKVTHKKKGVYKNCIVCGKQFYINQSRKDRAKFCSRKCKGINFSLNHSGKNNKFWKGGVTKINGYVYLKKTKHPNSNSSGYIAEHRLVMEKKINRRLLKNEYVHHKNGIKDDNKPENLELVSSSPHKGYVSCPHCNKRFLIR